MFFSRRPCAPAPAGDSRRFAYIDALRGAAACGVLVYHFFGSLTRNFEVQPVPAPLVWLASHGNLGVEVFFVLSGFVISYSVGAARVTPAYVGRFALRRSLRLDPPFWVAIALAYVLLRLMKGPAGTGELGSEAGTLLLNAVYLDRICGATSVLGIVSWTLCLEIQFYLLYVLLVGLTQLAAHRLPDGLCRALFFLPVTAYSLLIAFGVLPSPWRGLCLEYWYMFFLGVLASWVTFGQVPARWFVVGLVTLAAAVIVHWDIRAVAAALTALSIVLVARVDRLYDLLDWPWLQHLGRISYSLYLFHAVLGWPFINYGVRLVGGTPSLGEGIVLFLAATALSLGAAQLLYHWVERPALALSRRISLRTDRLSGEAADPGQHPATNQLLAAA